MLLNIILLPLCGFLGGSLFGRFLGKGTAILTTILTFTSFVISFFTLIDVINSGNVYIVFLKDWVHSEDLIINWAFCFDSLTCIMIVVVTFISSLVHLYSTEYMELDPHLPRFMSYLSLFTFFMLILVTADNFLQMFVGWEGVGVSSYLLINFWFTRIQANKAAIKAMLVNRVGDFFLLLGMFTIYVNFGSLDYETVFNNVSLISKNSFYFLGYQINSIDLICTFLFLGAMGKSAQIGLHTWLPDAMEGPTPVSALIHAATMVTAGVFLITRSSYFFENSTFGSSLVIVVGSMTAFFAATTGLFQNDMKRVIAYSTCSQLGYMVFACGLSGYEVGMFHLSNHAFFKALLFLAAGSVIHAVSDEQDMRKMGGLKNTLPLTYAVILIGSLALTGFPFLAGFYSKDIILEIAAMTYTSVGQFAYILGLLAAFCTAFYSMRLLFLVFLSNPNGNKKVILNVHEGTWRMTLPLFLLGLLSIFVGYLTKDLFIGFGNYFWNTSIFVLPKNYIMSDIEFLNIEFKLLPLIITLLGLLSAYCVYAFGVFKFFQIKTDKTFKTLAAFFNKKWYFDRIYNEFIVQSTLKSSYYYFYQDVDRGLIEKIGPSGISESINLFAKNIKQYQTGQVLNYLAYFTFFALLIILISNKSYFILVASISSLIILYYSTNKIIKV
jgi:proton-translocating NADH-quinone oxidoreductase chain L